jgi:hypothetical protein
LSAQIVVGLGELRKVVMEVVVLIKKVEVVSGDELRCLSRAALSRCKV